MTVEVATAAQVPLNSAIVVQWGKDYVVISHTSAGFKSFEARCPADLFKVRLSGSGKLSCVKCVFDLDGNPISGEAKQKNLHLRGIGKILEVNGVLYFQE